MMNFGFKKVCNEKLEITMIHQGILLQILMLIGFIVISLLVNRISKFSIMGKNERFIYIFWINVYYNNFTTIIIIDNVTKFNSLFL